MAVVSRRLNDQPHVPRFDTLLRFDPLTEKVYELERGALRARYLSVCILVGLAFYNLYNFTSIYLMPDILWLSVAVRVGLVTPASLLLAYMVLRVAAELREVLVLFGMIGAITAPICLFWLTRSALGDFTFGELALTLVFGGLVLTLRFRFVLVFVFAALVMMIAVVLTKPGIGEALQKAFLLQALTACAFIAVSNYVIEYRRCREFVETMKARSRAAAAEDATREMEALSLTDPLTGLPNRRALDEKVEGAFAKRCDVGVLMVDLDYFKQLNDTMGHPAGDLCLQEVAEAFADFAQQHDVFAARYGGEEFSILLEHHPVQEVVKRAELLVARIAAIGLAHPARPDGLDVVTISVGVGFRPAHLEKTIPQVFGEADECVYAAKKAGRNRVGVPEDLRAFVAA